MYFTRVTLRPDAADPQRIARVAQADAYGTHQYLWQLFPGEQERQFLFRRDDTAQWPRAYIVSRRAPTDSSQLWHIEHKPYEPMLREGQRFAFQLRANPVISRKDGTGKSRRHDVVMDAKRHAGGDSQMPELIQTAGFAWLAQRSENNGFGVERGEVRVDGYRQHRIRNRNRQIDFSSLDFTGLLTIIEPYRFLETLYGGLGPAKAFGCGLLLVRPA